MLVSFVHLSLGLIFWRRNVTAEIGVKTLFDLKPIPRRKTAVYTR